MPHHDPLNVLALQLLLALGGPVLSGDAGPAGPPPGEPAGARMHPAGGAASVDAAGPDPPAARAGPGPPAAHAAGEPRAQ